MIRVVSKDELDPLEAHEALLSLASNLRADDRAEVAATSDVPPDEAVIASWELSTTAFLVFDGEGQPVLVFGAAPSPTPGVGAAWLLGTDRIRAEAFHVARQTPRYVAALHRDYRVLWNYIDARNALSMRWLRWAGFHLIEANLEHGPERRLFYQFARHV